MASLADKPIRRVDPLAPTAFDNALAIGALAMLVALLAALWRGQGEWHLLSGLVWFHLATIAIALVLTPAMLVRRRGTRSHRQLGYVWLAAMVSTAIASLFIRQINAGTFSYIHLLSVLTLVVCTRLVLKARRHDAKGHRSEVRGIVLGALLIAGFFTFPFNRLLGQWLAGLPALAG